jgi:hypothetical protein
MRNDRSDDSAGALHANIGKRVEPSDTARDCVG